MFLSVLDKVDNYGNEILNLNVVDIKEVSLINGSWKLIIAGEYGT